MGWGSYHFYWEEKKNLFHLSSAFVRTMFQSRIWTFSLFEHFFCTPQTPHTWGRAFRSWKDFFLLPSIFLWAIEELTFFCSMLTCTRKKYKIHEENKRNYFLHELDQSQPFIQNMTTTKISALIFQKCIEIQIWFCLYCEYWLKFWRNWHLSLSETFLLLENTWREKLNIYVLHWRAIAKKSLQSCLNILVIVFHSQ